MLSKFSRWSSRTVRLIIAIEYSLDLFQSSLKNNPDCFWINGAKLIALNDKTLSVLTCNSAYTDAIRLTQITRLRMDSHQCEIIKVKQAGGYVGQ